MENCFRVGERIMCSSRTFCSKFAMLEGCHKSLIVIILLFVSLLLSIYFLPKLTKKNLRANEN